MRKNLLNFRKQEKSSPQISRPYFETPCTISRPRLHNVTPSDKPLSLPLFGSAADRSTAHFDVRPVLKRERGGERERAVE